jgi:hypothetical protein
VDAIARAYDTTLSRIPQQRTGPARTEVPPPAPTAPAPRLPSSTLPGGPAGASAAFARTAFGDTVEISGRAMAVSASLREPVADGAPPQDAGAAAAPADAEVAIEVDASPEAGEVAGAGELADAGELAGEITGEVAEEAVAPDDGSASVDDAAGCVENAADDVNDEAGGANQTGPKCDKQALALLYGTAAGRHGEEAREDKRDHEADGGGEDADGDPPPDDQRPR